jgi:excinuclease ABC subunit C
MTDGRLDRNRYRRFRLREAPGGDDYAALREMIRRRFERAAKGEERWSPPDLFVVDGGRGQLGVAAAVLDDLGITGVALAGIAKGRPVVGPDGPQPAPLDRIFVHGRTNPMKPRPGSSALHLIARLRDEAHRFANEYRENLDRNEKSSDSLNNIPGVGSATRRRLLDAFGSVARLRKAAEAEIAAVPRVGAARARTVMAALTRPSGSDKES